MWGIVFYIGAIILTCLFAYNQLPPESPRRPSKAVRAAIYAPFFMLLAWGSQQVGDWISRGNLNTEDFVYAWGLAGAAWGWTMAGFVVTGE